MVKKFTVRNNRIVKKKEAQKSKRIQNAVDPS